MKLLLNLTLLGCMIVWLPFSCTQEPEKPISTQPTLSLLDAKNVWDNKATLVAEINPQGQNVSVLFEYNIDSQWKQTETMTFSGNKNLEASKEITGLNPGTIYEYRATLIKNSGDSKLILDTAGPKSFTTLDKSILSIKENADYEWIEIIVNLIPKFDNTKVELSYISKNQTIVQTAPKKYSGNQPVEIVFKLNNLTKNTTYPITVKAINKTGAVLDTVLQTYALADIDGNKYRLVTIGEQTFIKENLATTRFANGDPIPLIKEDADWNKQKTPAYCYYENDLKNKEKYGCLYNFYVGVDKRELIKGFHTPSREEYIELINYLGGESVAGGKLKSTTTDWVQPNVGATNSSGFTALPGGWRGNSDIFSSIGYGVSFLTKSKEGEISYSFSVGSSHKVAHISGLSPLYRGKYIRLIKNK